MAANDRVVEFIGNHEKLQGALISKIAEGMSHAFLAHKDAAVAESDDLKLKDSMVKYETLEQVKDAKIKAAADKKAAAEAKKAAGAEAKAEGEKSPKKKAPSKGTWHGVKAVKEKDADGKEVTVKKEGDWEVAKYVSLGIEVKEFIRLIINRYAHEVYQFFEASGKRFPEPDLMAQIRKYSVNNMEYPFAAFVIQVNELMPSKTIIPTIYGDTQEALQAGMKSCFMGKDGVDQGILVKLSDEILRFLNLLVVLTGDAILYHHQAVNLALLFGVFNQLNSISRMAASKTGPIILPPEFLTFCRQIVASKTPKTPAKPRAASGAPRGRGRGKASNSNGAAAAAASEPVEDEDPNDFGAFDEALNDSNTGTGFDEED